MSTTPVHEARLLVRHLLDGQPHTRADLVAATGWARGTVTRRLHDLQRTGIVTEAEGQVFTGGRPSSQYAIDAASRFVVGIDLHAARATVGIGNLLGNVLAMRRDPVLIEDGPVPVLTAVLAAVRSAIADAKQDPAALLAVGLGLPAPVDHDLGRPAYPALMPGWDGFDIAGWLKAALAVPILVDNVANLLALGERAGSWPVDDLIFVTVGRGVGSGVISGGQLLTGSRGIAGDIGHIKVRREAALLCHCGNYGCLETVASGPAIERRLAQEGIAVGDHTLASLLLAGRQDVADIVRQAGRVVGEVLAAMVNVLNPAVIVVGGSVAQVGEYLVAGIRETVYASAMPLATRELVVAPAAAQDGAGVIGAVLLAANHALDYPAADRADQQRGGGNAQALLLHLNSAP
jgi:glucokinase